ncbi:MAG TPA: hypothetical protein VMW08_00570 [Acidimicrobiales bacterium]|nr:hypothetical protein [Acidimicrobiales bacterium]
MAVAPAFFEAERKALGLERWPDAGERITFLRRRSTEWETGEVVRVWVGIEVMIDLAEGAALCPALGDEFVARPSTRIE